MAPLSSHLPIPLQEAEGATIKAQKLSARLAEAQAAQTAAEQRCSKLEIRFARSSGGAAQLRALQLEDECSGLRQQLLEVQAAQEQQVRGPAPASSPAGQGQAAAQEWSRIKSSGRAATDVCLLPSAAVLRTADGTAAVTGSRPTQTNVLWVEAVADAAAAAGTGVAGRGVQRWCLVRVRCVGSSRGALGAVQREDGCAGLRLQLLQGSGNSG